MIDRNKENERAAPVASAPALDVYQVRAIGVRIREMHAGDPSYTHERLITDVHMFLVAQGSEATDATIQEALSVLR